MHRSTIGCTLAVVVAAGFIGSLSTAPAFAADTSAPQSTRGADADRSAAGRDARSAGESRTAYAQTPTDARVEVSEAGFTVFATPHCSVLAVDCSSWIHIDGVGDKYGVSTRDGYFIPWPSSVAEGDSLTGGLVKTWAHDVFGQFYYSSGCAFLEPITRPYSFRALTAGLTSQDDSAGSAVVSGTATPGASIQRDGVQVAVADPKTGSWSATVGGLPFGTTELVFRQVVGGTQRDTASVSVTRRTAELLTGVTSDGGELSTQRGDEVNVVFRTSAPLTGPLDGASVSFSAPSGAQLAPTSTSIRGQYRLPGETSWRDFAQVQLTDGTVTGNGTRLVYSWGSSSQTNLPAGSDIRFAVPVTAPVLSAGVGALEARASGSAPQGTFDTTASTSVRWSVANR